MSQSGENHHLKTLMTVVRLDLMIYFVVTKEKAFNRVTTHANIKLTGFMRVKLQRNDRLTALIVAHHIKNNKSQTKLFNLVN